MEEDIKIKKKIIINYGKDYFYPSIKILKYNKEKKVIIVARFEQYQKLYEREQPIYFR